MRDGERTMGTPKSVALALVEGVPEVRLRSMMGEWLVYFREHYLGTIEDGRLFLKDTPLSRACLAGTPLCAPHPGAKPSFLVEGLDAAQLYALFLQLIP